MCEQAKQQLTQFFHDLHTRQITPLVLEDVLNAGESVKTLQIVQSFLSLKLFHVTVTVEALDLELRAYQSFQLRNKQLQHFAHTFSEFVQGILLYFHFETEIKFCNRRHFRNQKGH